MEEQNYCKNCGEVLTGPHFCAHCGQKVITDRITVRHLFKRLIETLTNLEKGFWYTIYSMLVRPATVINDFISGKTLPYMPPLRFTIILGTVSVLLMFGIGNFEETQGEIQNMINPNANQETLEMQRKINEAIQPFLNVIPLLLVPFYALFTYLFYRKKGLNYAEHMVMHLYIFGVVTAIGFLFYIYYAISGSMNLAPIFGLGTYSLFLAYALRKMFKSSYLSAFFKALFSIILGYTCFLFFLAIIGIVGVLIYFIINGGPPNG